MQKEKRSNCPVEVWMNAKICLPEGDRGFAIAKLVEDENNEQSLFLALDPSLISGQENYTLETEKLNSSLLSSQQNLLNLPKGTAILLAPPKIFGNKFWIARISETDKIIGSGHSKLEENIVSYSLYELKRLKNFLEARSDQRTVFRTEILEIEPNAYRVKHFYTYDVSKNGVSISLEQGSKEYFEIGKEYLLQLRLHEGMDMPALNYRCVHIREDIISKSKIIGFELDDEKSSNPDVLYNLTLLSWNGPNPQTK
ncbi:MAG TPA: PilZ domain-containing protein [Vampirovibrionales bacterium]